MAAQCSVCTHQARQEIDEALVGAVPYRDIAERYGVTPSSLTRHRKGHLSPALVAVAAAAQAARAQTLAEKVESLYGRAEAILAAAEAGGAASLSLAAIRELRALCELLGRLSGELDDRPVVAVNVQASSDWIALRAAILSALAPHPAARADVLTALNLARDTKVIDHA